MANLISKATGNWTAAGTWGNVEIGAGAVQATISASTAITTNTTSYSTAFTVTNGSVIEGVLMYMQVTTADAAGNFRVALSADNGVTETRAVTVDIDDLATVTAQPSWIFFKFASTLTGDGGTDYRVGVAETGAGSVLVFRDGTAANWAHLLRLDTTAAPAAGDVTYIVGELSAEDTGADITVTMDETAATDYGAVNIAKRGVLTFGSTDSTAYLLKTSGTFTVFNDGTLNAGVGTARTSTDPTHEISIDNASNVDFGLEIELGATVNLNGPTMTAWTTLTADEAAGQTVISVADTTGWLPGDVLMFTGTTRTASEAETKTILTVDSATQVTLTAGLTNAHGGVSPIIGHVGNLTRNIKIHGTSTTLQAYMDIETTSTVDIDYAEFYNMGSATTSKRGIGISTTTGSCSINGSSIYDFGVASSIGTHLDNAANNNITISNNVYYNMAFTDMNTTLTTGTNYTITGNLFGRNTIISEPAVYLFDNGGTFTNNIIANSARTASSAEGALTINGTDAIGTISGNIVYGCAGPGVLLTGARMTGTLSNFTVWRNGTYNFAAVGAIASVTLDGWTMFGAASGNISFESTDLTNRFEILNSTLDSGSGLTCPIGIDFSTGVSDLYIENTTIGATTTHSTGDLRVVSPLTRVDAILHNVTLGSGTELVNQTSLSSRSRIGSQKHDQTAGNHKSFLSAGTITIDTTIFDVTPSARLTPNSASNKLEMDIGKARVDSGGTVTFSVKVRESVAGDGTDYNGNRIRLRVRKNVAAGIADDATLATATIASEGAFETISGTTDAVTDNGELTAYIDCDGTQGSINVDTGTVS